MHAIAKPTNVPAVNDPWAAFIGIPATDPEALHKARQQLSGRPYARDEIAGILAEYNQKIGNDAAAMQQIAALKLPDSACVVTGQQLGMMGGPAYTFLKGISCLLTARQAGAVPIFWLATEDHDIAEIDHTYLIDTFGNLQRFHLTLPKDGRPVEDLMLTAKNIDEIKTFWSVLGISYEEKLVPGTPYADVMVRLLVRLFAGTGMVFLEPKLLRHLAKPFFHREVNESEAIQQVLQNTSLRLETAGGQTPLSFTEGTNFFVKSKTGKRMRVRRDGQEFVIGAERYTPNQLLAIIDNEPERLSPNVAARPVLQNFLLPVIAYIAGPAEVDYHRQLGDYHRYHGVPMPCIVPRLSATLISPYIATLLEACHLTPWQEIPHRWPELMPELTLGEDQLQQDWVKSAQENFGTELTPEALERYVILGRRKLMHKIIRSRLHKKNVSGNSLHLLRNWMHPHEKPQERALNWWGFQAHSQENIIAACLNSLQWNAYAHQYLYYS